MTTLHISALTKRFHAGVQGCTATALVLDRVDLALWPGEIVALEGARGSGKSTLLRCAAQHLRPDSGSITWLGGNARAHERVTFLDAGEAMRSGVSAPSGAFYSRLEHAISRDTPLLLVDDLTALGALELRLSTLLLRKHAAAGGSVLVAATPGLAPSPLATRSLLLHNAQLIHRKNRSAARITASSFDSRARASARSTYGRSLRSPQ